MVTLIQGFLVTSGGECSAGSSRGYGVITILVVRFDHRVDREDITIIILDTKLVPDFVLHACCFFIAGP